VGFDCTEIVMDFDIVFINDVEFGS
jgi:hypothetical protein